MKKIFLILFLIQNVSVLYPQYDDPYQYYPMAVGNYWYYFAGPNNYYTEKIYEDSTDSNGNRFFWIHNRLLNHAYRPNYCIDTNYFVIKNHEYILKLNAKLGEKWWLLQNGDTTRGRLCKLTYIEDGEYLGIKTRFLKYTTYTRVTDINEHYDSYDHSEVLAYGIGMIFHDNDYEYPYELGGAIIDGKVIGNPVGIEENTAGYLPDNFVLFQNYPNPFNPSTKIKYRLPTESYIVINVFNSLGERVKTLYEGIKREGEYLVEFNGAGLTSGVYFIQLVSENVKKTIKALLIK